MHYFTTVSRYALLVHSFFLVRFFYGLALCVGLAVIAIKLSEVGWLQANGFGSLTLAIVLGMIIGNTVYRNISVYCTPGVQFAKQNLLRLAIVLYGFRLTFQDVSNMGVAGIFADILVVLTTFGLAYWFGVKKLRLDHETALLIGSGSAICGAAAVMATGSIIRARTSQVTIAIATVVIFGTIALFVYPILFNISQAWSFIPGGVHGFGLYTGSTVHEVAQVVAAAQQMGPGAVDTAVIAKMVRVMMLAPVLLCLAYVLGRKKVQPRGSKLMIPWFAFGFIGVVGLNSMSWIPSYVVTIIIQIDAFLLAMAMVALGLTTHISVIRDAGLKPLRLALLLFIWLVFGGVAISWIVWILFN